MFRTLSALLGAVFFVGGLAACLASAYYVFRDWHALNVFYARFEKLAMSDAPLRSVFIASTEQAAFRLNCFADGVGVLLGAILCGVGWLQITRFATLPRKHCHSEGGHSI